MPSWPQSWAKPINILENLGVFIFHLLPVSMRYLLLICNFMFRKSVTHYFCFQFLTSYSVWYQCVNKLHMVSYLAFGTNFFPKNTFAETLNTTDCVNDVTRIGSAQEFYAAFELTRRLTKLDVICIFFSNMLSISSHISENLSDPKFLYFNIFTWTLGRCLKLLSGT